MAIFLWDTILHSSTHNFVVGAYLVAFFSHWDPLWEKSGAKDLTSSSASGSCSGSASRISRAPHRWKHGKRMGFLTDIMSYPWTKSKVYSNYIALPWVDWSSLHHFTAKDSLLIKKNFWNKVSTLSFEPLEEKKKRLFWQTPSMAESRIPSLTTSPLILPIPISEFLFSSIFSHQQPSSRRPWPSLGPSPLHCKIWGRNTTVGLLGPKQTTSCLPTIPA